MKILIINDFYTYDILSGPERTAALIYDALQKKGHKVYILTGFLKDKKKSSRIYSILPIYFSLYESYSKLPWWQKVRIDLLSFWIAKRLLRRIQPDVIVVRSVRYISFWSVTAAMTKHRRCFFLAPDNWLALRKKACSKNSLANSIRLKLIYKNFNFKIITCPSEWLKEKFINAGFSNQKLTLLPHGVDTNHFYPINTKILQKEKKILYVGRVFRVKGVEIAIEALHRLPYLKPHNIILEIVGEGGQLYTQILKDKVQKLGLKKNVQFRGKIEQKKLPEIFAEASVVVVPSFTEAFGIVAIEAMSCERPVIASKVGGLSEIIQDGENGLLVPPNDPEALANAISFLLENPEKASRIAKKARKEVKRKYSAEKFIAKLEKIIGA